MHNVGCVLYIPLEAHECRGNLKKNPWVSPSAERQNPARCRETLLDGIRTQSRAPMCGALYEVGTLPKGKYQNKG